MWQVPQLHRAAVMHHCARKRQRHCEAAGLLLTKSELLKLDLWEKNQSHQIIFGLLQTSSRSWSQSLGLMAESHLGHSYMHHLPWRTDVGGKMSTWIFTGCCSTCRHAWAFFLKRCIYKVDARRYEKTVKYLCVMKKAWACSRTPDWCHLHHDGHVLSTSFSHSTCFHRIAGRHFGINQDWATYLPFSSDLWKLLGSRWWSEPQASDTGVAGPAPGWGTSPEEACTPAAGWAVIWSCPPPRTGDFFFSKMFYLQIFPHLIR